MTKSQTHKTISITHKTYETLVSAKIDIPKYELVSNSLFADRMIIAGIEATLRAQEGIE